MVVSEDIRTDSIGIVFEGLVELSEYKALLNSNDFEDRNRRKLRILPDFQGNCAKSPRCLSGRSLLFKQ